MLFPSNKLGTLVRILILLDVKAVLTTIQMHGVSGLKKNTHLPSNLTFTTGSSLVIHIISFFMVRNAGHILLNQFHILKDTKWGCKAAGTRTNIGFHVSASATYLSL